MGVDAAILLLLYHHLSLSYLKLLFSVCAFSTDLIQLSHIA